MTKLQMQKEQLLSELDHRFYGREVPLFTYINGTYVFADRWLLELDETQKIFNELGLTIEECLAQMLKRKWDDEFERKMKAIIKSVNDYCLRHIDEERWFPLNDYMILWMGFDGIQLQFQDNILVVRRNKIEFSTQFFVILYEPFSYFLPSAAKRAISRWWNRFRLTILSDGL